MKRFAVLIIISILLYVPVSVYALNVPLIVTEYSGTDRISEPVTSGVPLPEQENILSVNSLEITDSQGNPIPAQFTVLARWNGTIEDETKPIKWVLLDFQANVMANSNALYYLRDAFNGGNVKTSNLSVQEDNDKIIVNTGKAKFQISKHYFNLFDYVWIDKDNDGETDDIIFSQPGEGGLVLVDSNKTMFSTLLEPPEEIEIEEEGPLRTVIRIRGVFRSHEGTYFAPSIPSTENATKENLDRIGYSYSSTFNEKKFSQPYNHSIFYYNCRIYFYNNKDYVRIFLTFENNGANGRTNPEQYFAPIQTVYFDSIDMILKTNNPSQTSVLSEDSFAQLGTSDNFTLYQAWHENLTDGVKDTLEPLFDRGIYYFTKKNNQQLSSGKTNPGWIDVNSGSQGIGLAIRHFWQNFPKKFAVTPSEIRVGLWPKEGYYPYCRSADFPDTKYDIYCRKGGRDAGVYLFDSGRHKTYEMILRFYSGQQDSTTQHVSKALEEPLMALAPSEWYADSKALGMIAPAGLSSSNPEMNEALQRFDRLQTAMVYPEDSDNGWTIENIKTKNPPHWEFRKQNRFWGWMGFGDLLWSGQSPSALHYDWTYSMFLHYIRTGKRKFFDRGVEMARHRYDIDQYHGDRSDINNNHRWVNHFQFYESSGHADPTISSWVPSRVSGPTHTWNGGLILYYLLTGDKLALDAAEENVKGVLNYFGKGGIRDATTSHCTNDEIRYEGWSIVNLLNVYRVTGNPEYLNVAKNIAKNRLYYTEEMIGGNGYWGCDQSSGGCINQIKPLECVPVACGKCNGTQWSTMYIYVIEALINTHYETHDKNISILLVKMADFLKDKFLKGGDFNGSLYKPLQCSYLWVENKSQEGGEIVKNFFWTDIFAYVYNITGNAEYLEWARKTFRDAVFYYTFAGSRYLNPQSRSVISYIDGQFPNSHTKAHGWIGRTNEVYLYTEWQLQKGKLKLLSEKLPNATINNPYSYFLIVSGGTPPYEWVLTEGELPANFIVNSTTGEIKGTPLSEGNYTFTIEVRDSAENSETISRTFWITVNPPQEETGYCKADTNHNGRIDLPEMLSFIEEWKRSRASLKEVVDIIRMWKNEGS